jgi:pimeloyl-ACP methyl ester carboxylesterase
MTPSSGPGGTYVAESGTPGSPAIVFIHGAGQSGREWRGHMARLAAFQPSGTGHPEASLTRPPARTRGVHARHRGPRRSRPAA